MEIFGVFGIDLKILIVQIINFGVLLVILWYLLYRPLASLIEKRRAQIIEGVANAERAENALKDADAKRAEIVTDASKEAEILLATARESAKTKEDTMVLLAKEKADRLVAEAEIAAEQAKRKATDEARGEVAKLVVLGTEKLLREKNTV